MRKAILPLPTVFLFAAFALSACGVQKDKSFNTNQANLAAKNSAKESYRFSVDGCDTGKQDFVAKDAESARKLLCKALTEEKRNNSCAQELRNFQFQKRCGPTPVPAPTATPAPTTTPAPPVPPTPNTAEKDEADFKNRLSHLFVENIQVATGLTTANAALANKLADDLRSCGISYMGPICTDYTTVYMSQLSSPFKNKEQNLFVLDLRVRGADAALIFSFEVTGTGADRKSSTVKIYRGLQPYGETSLTTYLGDRRLTTELATAQLTEVSIDSVWKKLPAAKDVKELYHLSDLALSLSSAEQLADAKSKIAAAILTQKSMIAGARETSYQASLFYFLVDKVGATKETLLPICEDLLSSKTPELKRTAATFLLEQDTVRTELKPVVVEALIHSRSDTRLRALTALSKTKLSSIEQNQILQRIGDSNDAVRTAANAAADAMVLTIDNEYTLDQLLKSSNPETVKEANLLLAKMKH